ncbi:MAG TPA: hypothetical protein VK674_06295 [Candidatus Limnocylindria bacterium]|nr:hypothetical protein [Candidatus Limnocylindria bacterium]
MKIRLVQTSPVSPEQYDAFDEAGNRVGYLRLRHGCFRVEVPDVGGKGVYDAHPKGDGMFQQDEREYFLQKAIGNSTGPIHEPKTSKK